MNPNTETTFTTDARTFDLTDVEVKKAFARNVLNLNGDQPADKQLNLRDLKKAIGLPVFVGKMAKDGQGALTKTMVEAARSTLDCHVRQLFKGVPQMAEGTAAGQDDDTVVRGRFPAASISMPPRTDEAYWNRLLAALIESRCYSHDAALQRYQQELRGEPVMPIYELVVTIITKALNTLAPTESPLAEFLDQISARQWEELKATVQDHENKVKSA